MQDAARRAVREFVSRGQHRDRVGAAAALIRNDHADALRPPPVPGKIAANVRAALQGLQFGGHPGDPEVDADWGEPGLTPTERVIAWNTLEVLAMRTGNPDFPVNAIPPTAKATMHMRFVVGTDVSDVPQRVREHLAARGFGDIEVGDGIVMHATRLDPDNAWVRFCLASMENSTGKRPALLPNLGGSLPNASSPTSWACRRSGAAQLPGVQPARARRTPAGAGRARGAGDDDRALLGPRRAGGVAAATRSRGHPCCTLGRRC